VRVAVVGAGTARVFDEVSQSDDQSLEVAFSPSKGILSCGFYDVLSTCIFAKTNALLFILNYLSALMNFSCSSAMGEVLASELPRGSESTCKVLYPASAKASREIRESVFCLQLESYCYFLLLSLRPHVSHIYCVSFFMVLHIDSGPVNFLFSS